VIRLDFKNADRLYRNDHRWCTLPGIDFPEDCRLAGYTPVAKRGKVTVAVKDGWFHLIRHVPVDQRFDGKNMVQSLQLDVRYHDDVDVIDPT